MRMTPLPGWRRGLPVVVLFVAQVLAGCAGQSTSLAGPLATDEGSLASPAEFGEDTGALEGWVADDSVQPVAGALLVLFPVVGDEAMAETLSDLAARFSFSYLAPGEYRLTVSAAGYANATRFVGVEAGTSTNVQILLTTMASREPYATLAIKDGMITCGFAAVWFSGYCPVGAPPTSPLDWSGKQRLLFPVSQGVAAAVLEATWPQTTAVIRMQFYNGSVPYTHMVIGEAIGTPVLRSEFEPGKMLAGGGGGIAGGKSGFPNGTQASNITINNYYEGSYRKDVNDTLGSACAPRATAGQSAQCAGIGFVLDFRFRQYFTQFIFAAPDRVREYSAVPDS